MTVFDAGFAGAPPHPLPLTRGARDRLATLDHPAQRLNVIARLLAGLAVPAALWRPVAADGDLPELRLDDTTIVAWRTIERMAAATGRTPRAFLEYVDALLRCDALFDALGDRPPAADDLGLLDEPFDATDALAAVEPTAMLLAWTDAEEHPTTGAALLVYADANGPGRLLARRDDTADGGTSVELLARWHGGGPVHRDDARIAAVVRRLVARRRVLQPLPPVLHAADGRGSDPAGDDGNDRDLDAGLGRAVREAILAGVIARPAGIRPVDPAGWFAQATAATRVRRAFDALGAAMGTLDASRGNETGAGAESETEAESD